MMLIQHNFQIFYPDLIQSYKYSYEITIMFWLTFLTIYAIWIGWIIIDLANTSVDNGRGEEIEEESDNILYVNQEGRLLEIEVYAL
jgi:hypothetical protein